MKAFKSLRFQLVVLLLLPLALFGAAAVWFTWEGVESLVEKRLQKEIELVARALRVPVEQALQRGQVDSIRRSLDAVFEIGRVYGAYVYDADGERIAAAGEARPGLPEQMAALELVETGEETGRYADLSGEAVFSYFVPLTDATGRIVGLLQVVRLESEIALRLQKIRTRGLFVWGVVLAIMLLITFFGHRLAVGRHVGNLLGSMALIESGQRGHRADLSGPSEIASVAAGLNRMLDGLDRMTDELDLQRKERRHMERRMLEQQNLARLGQFSSGVAHELGAPLTIIDGDTRRLQLEPGLGADARRRLLRIRRQVARTRELVAQLMEFSRSDHSEPRTIDLNRLLQRTLAAVQPECENRKIILEYNPPPSKMTVSGWELRLEHAVLNLIRNAVEAAQFRVKVTLEARKDRQQILVVVEDDGPGVPPSQREKIFEPFHTAGKGAGGTGLGLAIVHGVAEEHGAGIEVSQSRVLGGSRIALLLEESLA